MTTAEIELGYRPLATYATAVRSTIDWLVKTPPAAAEDAADSFDYAAEDAFLRLLT